MGGPSKQSDGRAGRRIGRLGALALILAVGLAASPAFAGPFRVIGYDTKANAVANSSVAYGEGLGVLYTNPALLSRYPDTFQIGVTFWQPKFRVHLFEKPTGTDVPISLYDSKMGTTEGQQDLALPTVELKNKRGDTNVDDPYAYVGFGGSMSLKIKGLRAGSYMIIPIDSLHIASMTTYHANEYEQYFSNKVHLTTFGEWGKLIDGVMGVSYAPIDLFSFGVALKIGMSTVAKVDIYMPDATVQDYSLINTRAEIALSLKPIVGFQIQPTDYLGIGLVWRHWSYMELTGGGDMGLWQLHETSNSYTVPKRVNQKYKLALDYEPMEVAASLGFRMSGFTTQVTATYNFWRFYLDQHHQTPQDAAHHPPAAYTTDPLADGGASRFKFKDTVSVTASLQYEYFCNKHVSLGIDSGFGYHPSPVPAQVGRTNYADTAVFVGSLGHRLDFTLLDQKFGFDVGMQYWRMVTRSVHKDPNLIVDEFADSVTTIVGDLPMAEAQGLQTNNPGFPGYRVEGWMFLFSASLRYVF